AGSFVLMNENGVSPKTPLLTPEELPSGRVLSVYCSGGLMTAGDVSPEDRGRVIDRPYSRVLQFRLRFRRQAKWESGVPQKVQCSRCCTSCANEDELRR